MVSKTILASRVLCHSGLGTLLRRTAGHQGFVVLNYHRVGNPGNSDLDRDVFSATAEAFARQLKFLKAECDVITPQDIADLPAQGRGNFAMITFDDGYRDNYEIAFPLLREQGLKAVFFIVTGFVDRVRLSWWDEIAWMLRHCDRERVGPTATIPIAVELGPGIQAAIDQVLGIYKRLPPESADLFLDDLAQATGSGRAPAHLANQIWMTWEMIREMRDAGMVIGGHTVNHPVLATLPRTAQEREILGCAQMLQERLGQSMEYFSYPRGKPDSFNQDTRACLCKAKVKYAFSYYGGMNRSDDADPLDIRRVGVETSTPIEHFEAMVTWPGLFA